MFTPACLDVALEVLERNYDGHQAEIHPLLH
jgi:hypothetical protein